MSQSSSIKQVLSNLRNSVVLPSSRDKEKDSKYTGNVPSFKQFMAEKEKGLITSHPPSEIDWKLEKSSSNTIAAVDIPVKKKSIVAMHEKRQLSFLKPSPSSQLPSETSKTLELGNEMYSSSTESLKKIVLEEMEKPNYDPFAPTDR